MIATLRNESEESFNALIRPSALRLEENHGSGKKKWNQYKRSDNLLSHVPMAADGTKDNADGAFNLEKFGISIVIHVAQTRNRKLGYLVE